MATNDFLAYADGGGANVITQATYAAASYITNGLGSGILASNVYNKMIRQASIAAYLNGQIIVDYLGVNAADNSDLVTLLANFKAAIAAPSAAKPRAWYRFSSDAIAFICRVFSRRFCW